MNSGILNDLDVHPRIIEAARKGGYSSSWKIISYSLGELKTKTGLSSLDTERLMNAAAQQCCPSYITGYQMMIDPTFNTYATISTNCTKLDNILNGGIPCRGVTELAGESGSGKTQFGLQLALQCQLPVKQGGLGKGVAYICTETQFPVSRLNQLISFRKHQSTYNGKKFSDNIYVHHLPDMDNLVDCVRYQLSQFVTQKNIGLVIIDSVASVFRAGEEPQEIKSKMVQQLGFRLRQLADKHGVAILAINQVTSAIDGNVHGIVDDNIVPALGLSWANLVTTRMMLRNTLFGVTQIENQESSKDSEHLEQSSEDAEYRNQSSLKSSEDVGHRNQSSLKSSEDVGHRNRSSEDAEHRNQSSLKSSEDVGHHSNSSLKEFRVRTFDILFCPWLAKRSSTFIVRKDGIKDVNSSSLTLLKDD